MGAVAGGRAVDGDAAHAVGDGGDGGRALHDAEEAGGVFSVGPYFASHGAAADDHRASTLAHKTGGIQFIVRAFSAGDVYLHVAVADIDIAP